MQSLTVSQRILVHLSLFSHLKEEYECPPEVTQKGIAGALGLSRSHVALELKKLVEEGSVTTRLAHVTAARSRRKVYFLARDGERVAAALRSRAREGEARWVDDSGELREGPGYELLQAARRQRRPLTPVYEGILRGDVVDLRLPEEEARPEAVAHVIGREREREHLRLWLEEGPMVLAITGPAGIGKTTLARALMEEVQQAVWVQVFPFHSAASLLAAIARGLAGLGRARLMAHLRTNPQDFSEAGVLLSAEAAGTLLIVDDVGSSPEAAAVLRIFLDRRPPGCKLLLTARGRPDFLGAEDLMEGLWEEMPLGGLTRESSRQLVVGLGGDPGQADELAKAAGGHPLLLKLYSSVPMVSSPRVESLLLEEVLGGLEPEAERALMLAIAFRRPFPAEALRPAGLTSVQQLLRRGLLVQTGNGYGVHEVVANLLFRHLGDAEPAAHKRAARFWESQEEWLEALYHLGRLGDVNQLSSLARERVDEILENGEAKELLEVLETAGSKGTAEIALAKALALDYMGRWPEALMMVKEGMRTSSQGQEVAFLLLRGRVHSKMGDLERAEEAFRRAAELAEVEGIEMDVGLALYGLGIVHRKTGRLDRSERCLSRCLGIFKGLQASREMGRAEMEMGIVHLQSGNLEMAVEWFERSKPALATRREDAAYLHNNLGIAYSKLSRQEDGLRAFEESARLAEAAGMVRARGYAMANAADLHVELGRLELAAEHCRTSLSIFEDLQDPIMISACHANMAKVERARGRLDRAEALYLRSIEGLKGTTAPHSLAARLLELSDLYEEMGRDEEAHRLRSRALELLRESSSGT